MLKFSRFVFFYSVTGDE